MHPRSYLNYNQLSLGLQFILFFMLSYGNQVDLEASGNSIFQQFKAIVLSISRVATKVRGFYTE